MVKRSSELTTITVNKEIAKLLHTYCVFHDLKVSDFVTQLIEEKLSSFKERLKELRKLGN